MRTYRLAAFFCSVSLSIGCSRSGATTAIQPETPASETTLRSEPTTLDISDVCGFSDPATYSEPAADGLVDVPPNDPNIRYLGRIDCSDPAAPSFAFPAVSIRVRFTGEALDLKLQDHGVGGAQGTNYYDVSIDGAAPTLLEVTPQQEVYELARGLGVGEHAAEIVNRVESSPQGRGNNGKGEILGFRISEGASLLPVAPRPRRVEFIGDSITCGYGNEVSTTDPDTAPYTTRNSNANLSYGAVTARLLDAEYMAVAYSGRGISRNYTGLAGDTLPEMYLKSLPDDPDAAAWRIAAYTPDVVVINLGTNDFSPGGVDREAYRKAYLDFLGTLRGYYPAATFITAVGPMLSDFYPPGESAWTNIQADVQEVVAARRAAGDVDVHYLAFAPQSAPYGEDWHPTVATHEAMANRLVTVIRKIRDW